MKKYQAVLFALLAVLALAAVTAGSASAETTLLAGWLFNAAPVTALFTAGTSGELKLTTLVLGVTGVEVVCSGIFDGSVGPSGEDEVTALLNLAKEEISKTPLVGLSLDCEVIVGSSTVRCAVKELAELWPDALPWHTLLVLMESGAFLDLFLGAETGYHVFCPELGGENLCDGPTSTTMTNGATDVIGVFDATSEKASCTTGGTGAGDILGEGLTFEEPGTLSVSSE